MLSQLPREEILWSIIGSGIGVEMVEQMLYDGMVVSIIFSPIVTRALSVAASS